tara:strand:+ start:549 stop:929 length:381 start_codon:yes stop_codon:yes gene_type:complete
MTITKQKVDMMRPWIKEALNKGNLPEDWEFDLGKCTYNSAWAEYKLLVKVKDGDTREMYNLRLVARLRGIDINKTSQLDGKEIKLVGFVENARKYPYIIEVIDSGVKFKMPEDRIRKHFGLENNHG